MFFCPIFCLEPAQGEEKAVVHMQLCPGSGGTAVRAATGGGGVAYCAVRLAEGGITGGLAVLLLLLVFCLYLWLPKTLPKEVHQRLAQVLLRPLAVQEVALIRIDL